MAEIDRLTIHDYGLDGQVLMENAGRSVARWLRERLGDGRHPVAFLCGPGNNGGDGWVAARAWMDLGGHSTVYFLSDRLQGDALCNFQRAKKWGIAHRPIEGDAPDWSGYGFVVDALFGTGLKRDLAGVVMNWVVSLPAEKTLAVDIPSGVDSASGQVLGTSVAAQATMTFGLPKWGHLLQPGASRCGQLIVEPIGFPAVLLEGDIAQARLLTGQTVQAWLPQGSPTTHKGSAGKVMLIAGSKRYPGAGYLASLGALRSGAGLVYSYAPAAVTERLPVEAIGVQLEGDFLSKADLERTLEGLKTVDGLCIGPGLGDHPETLAVVVQLLKDCQCPAVVDADALRALPERLNPSMLLTPHAGELARMLGTTVSDIDLHRVQRVREAAARWDCCVLLKGDPTLICQPDGQVLVSQQGTSVLAQGGSGDVLSGVCSALLVRGLSSQRAGGLAAFVHGVAGQLSGVSTGLGAQALGELLPKAFTLCARQAWVKQS